MELRAVIEALRNIPDGMYVWVSTDSCYVKRGGVNGLRDGLLTAGRTLWGSQWRINEDTDHEECAFGDTELPLVPSNWVGDTPLEEVYIMVDKHPAQAPQELLVSDSSAYPSSPVTDAAPCSLSDTENDTSTGGSANSESAKHGTGSSAETILVD
jgi:hypothetical protein